jgi:hypothetical protein
MPAATRTRRPISQTPGPGVHSRAVRATAVDVVPFAPRPLRGRALLVSAFALAFFAVAPNAWAQTRILVLPVQAPADTPEDAATAQTLTRAIETSLGSAAVVQIVTPAAVSATLELEAQRQCLGGDPSASCVTELADAVDVDFVARAQLGRLGSEYVLTLALIDGDDAIVAAQGQRRAESDNPSALLDQIPSLCKEVAADAELSTKQKRRRSAPVVPLAVAGVGAAVAGLGVGAVVVRGVFVDDFNRGRLDRTGAVLFDALDEPLLYGGLGAIVVGGLTALGAGGYAVWTVVAPEE